MQKQNMNQDLPYIALIERAREEHLLDGLACPVVLGAYKDGSPAVFDLMKERSMITSGGCYSWDSSSYTPLDRAILTNLYFKTDTRFFLIDDVWRDSAEFFELIPQIPETYPGPSDETISLLAGIRLGLKMKLGDDYLKKITPSVKDTFPSILTVFELNGSRGPLTNFTHLSHLAEDGDGINIAINLSVKEKELKGIIDDAGMDFFPWRILRPLEDKSLMEKLIPGSSSFSPNNNSTFIVKSSKGIEEIDLLENIKDFGVIIDGNRGFHYSPDD